MGLPWFFKDEKKLREGRKQRVLERIQGEKRRVKRVSSSSKSAAALASAKKKKNPFTIPIVTERSEVTMEKMSSTSRVFFCDAMYS